MARIDIRPFYGSSPRTAERQLGEGFAVEAANLILTNGEIRPIREPELVNIPSVTGPWVSVYRAASRDQEVWMAWNRDVDIVRAPLPPSAEPRFYWSGDGEPRFASFSDLPGTFYSLGIPKPQTKPTVAPSGGTGADVTRVYVYTFFSALGEESAPSPASTLATGKVDGTWAISNMDAFPANSGSGTASHAAGITTFNNTGFHWLRVGEEIVIGGQTVPVLSVVDADTFTVAGNFAAATTWARVAPWNTAGIKRRLYRSEGTAAQFQLVADNVGTTYNDTLLATAILGDELISLGWELPPVNLKGLIDLPNGCLVGFFDNQVCYSEPFQPHAWPTSYRRGTTFDVVGIGHFGTTVVACTESDPYICEGSDPSIVTAESANQVWPCLSKRSVISVGDGVLYATTNGMAYVGMKGANIWTQGLFTRYEWEPLTPESMVAAKAEGRIFVRFESVDGSKGVLIFDQENPQIGLSILSLFPDEIYSDRVNGQFYLVDDKGIKRYDAADGARVNYSWVSKEYTFEKPVNFGACKVDFVSEQTLADVLAEQARFDAEVLANKTLVANYSGMGGVNGTYVNNLVNNGSDVMDITPPDVSASTITVLAKTARDQELRVVYSRQLVVDERPFKLKAGFKADVWQVALSGTLRIKSVKVAETMKALEQQ